MYRVFYNSFATPDLYALIRSAAPARCELVTLEADSDDERCRKIADCEAVVVASYPLQRCVLEAGTRLRVVHHQGVGYHDTVDVEELAARQLPLALTPGGTTDSVAEHTILLMLSALRRASYADRELRLGRWHINSLRTVSREIRGCCIGYVGMGRIAQAVAERLRCFGTSGIYHDPHVELPADRERALGVERVGLEALLERADVVTIHAPLTAATRHLFDAHAFARMRPSAVLVNTARGPIVDQAALVETLQSGGIAGAGLDVFEVEPLPADSLLVALPNVTLTPHFSAGTREAMLEKMRFVLANICRFLDGGALENAVELRAQPRPGASGLAAG